MDELVERRPDSPVNDHFRRAIALGESALGKTAPNPPVGAVVVARDGRAFEGVTQPFPGRHAEAIALEAAGDAARGATLYVTLEPCPHVGHNPSCAQMAIDKGVARVVVGVEDPDERVCGAGVERLRAAGVEVVVGEGKPLVERYLMAYMHQRRTGRPLVILKMAMTLDGHTAAPDRSSRWITGDEARRDVHLLRAHSDAVVVGAGTVRIDDPSLTVRLDGDFHQPRRVVLGDFPEDARVSPALAWQRSLSELLDELAREGCLQVLVEGGAHVAARFHDEGLVDRYVFYVAPAILGGDDGTPVMTGRGGASMADAWRGRLVDVARVGDDVRIVVEKRVP